MYVLLFKKLLLLHTRNNNIDRKNKSLEKIDDPFISCISKINNVLTGNAEDLNIVLPMYNLIEYSKNYRNTTRSLWNYYRDESNYPPADNYSADPITNSKFFEYKTSITGSTYNVDETITNAEANEIDNRAYDANKFGTKEVEIVIP